MKASQENVELNDNGEGFAPDMHANLENAGTETIYDGIRNALQATSPQLRKGHSETKVCRDRQGGSCMHRGENGVESSSVSELHRENFPVMQNRDTVTRATVEVLKKPTGAFGAMLGSAAAKRRFDIDKKDKEEIKLESIRTSVSLPFHSFTGKNDPKPVEEPTPVSEIQRDVESVAVPPASSSLQEIIVLDDDSDLEVLENDESKTKDSHGDDRTDKEHASLSDLSTSFQKCFQSNNQSRAIENVQKSQEPTGLVGLKPFDYAAAIRFGKGPQKESAEVGEKDKSSNDSVGRKRNSVVRGVEKDGTKEFPQGRRRQAFPATGNRSATFR